MKDELKTKGQLVDELAEMRQRMAELETADTERKRAEEKIEHLNLVLRAIRNVNQLITRERDRDRLLQDACETLIETRGYHSAWIALLDESGQVVTTAEAGLGEDFLPLVEQLKDGELTDCGRRALRQPGVVVTEDPASTCADCPLSSMYDGMGAVTIRLEYGGKVYGLLSVSIPRDLTADEEEQGLFEEVAGDIAFALHSIELGEERKRAEKALAYERDLFHGLMHNIPDRIYFKDTQGRFVRVSRALADTHGFSDPAQIVGKTDFDFFAEEQAQQFFAAEKEVMLSGQPVVGKEEKEVWLNGRETWCSTTMMPFRDKEGRTIGIIGIARDITELKQAEEAVRRYVDIVNNMQLGLQVYQLQNLEDDRTLKLIATNPAGTQFIGLEMKDVLGKTIDEVSPGFREVELPQTYADVVRTGISAELEQEVYYDEDRIAEAWLSIKAFPLPGDCVGVLFEDITLQKQSEESLRQSRIRYRAMLEDQTELICRFLPDGGLVFVNEACCRYFGQQPSALIGQGFTQLILEEDRARVQECLASLSSEKPVVTYECRTMRSDGETCWLRWTGRAIFDEGDSLIEFQSVGRDITERKAAEKALKEYSDRLEEMVEERTQELRDAQEQLVRREKLAVLGQLAGGVGHELRNPLGAISNAAYFLNMVLEEPEPEVQETLEILEKEVKTSEKIISSLLDFARAKSPTRRKVDVNEVVEEALSRATVPGNVEVVSQLDEALPIMLADPDQLAQVFGNIILNAIQAMPEGGRLLVKSEVPSPDWVTVSIADTGVGIPKENLGKLFEPLFTTKAKGVGLGLAVVKTLVEGHGGTIEVESEVGVGTTFTVRLPMPGSQLIR